MIKLHEIHKVYTQGKTGFHALKNINLYFEKGEFISIFGPSGCGKTTLLNILGGLDTPTSGDMVMNDRLTTNFKEKEWDYFRNHGIGFVFQQYNLIEHLPIVENVALSLKLGGLNNKKSKYEARELLKKVGLENHLHKLPGELSGGERQRVAIARALINDPDIILADEPTGALDKKTGREVMDLIKSICKDKLVIVVTHNRKIAEEYSTRIIELKDGRVHSDTHPHDSKVKISNIRTKLRKKLKFKEAIRLSFYNIKGKIWRTLLVSLGLSIGIVGLILVDALFNSIREGLTEQESILADNPDVYIHDDYETNPDIKGLQADIEDFGYFSEVLYAPRTYYTILEDKTNDALLASPVMREGIETPKSDRITKTFTSILGDGHLPVNDDELALHISVAEELISSNISLTDDEIWDELKGNVYIIYDEYEYIPYDSDLYRAYENGTCITTGHWDGTTINPPVGYDDVILGNFAANIISLNKYRSTQIMISEDQSIFCSDYDTLSWRIDYSAPIGTGKEVTLVGIHDNRLFGQLMLSDNVIFDTQYYSESIYEGIPSSNLYDSSIRYRGFISKDYEDEKSSIIITLENEEDYLITENMNNEMNIFAGLANFFMYILQFIFSSIIFIAILTGGLMLLLILLISIIERKREIGLIRAMGGTRSDVRIIYTGETTIIGLISGLMSIVLSLIIVAILNRVLYNNYLDTILDYLPFVDPEHLLSINYLKLLWAIVGSILIAILSGLIPAIRAGNKKPIEALRNE